MPLFWKRSAPSASTRASVPTGGGRATVTADDGRLELAITAPGKQLPGLEQVVGSHLERFGERDALRVDWCRD